MVEVRSHENEKHFQVEQSKADDSKSEVAEYCGLSVDVVWQMAHSTLIRYRDREFVIATEDLCFQRSLRCAA